MNNIPNAQGYDCKKVVYQAWYMKPIPQKLICIGNYSQVLRIIYISLTNLKTKSKEMEDFKDATVRAITALKCLGIQHDADLYQIEIPPVGTVLRKGFMNTGDLILTTRIREELVALQDKAINDINQQVAYYMGMNMLENPEDYGLI
jgi:hypothetical protein